MPRTARSIRENDAITAAATLLSAASPAARILSPLKALAGHMLLRWRTRRDYRQLMAMSDHELSDIGISRGYIEGSIRHGHRGQGAASD